ncbi:hypothetical protein CEUSTIGMA_g6355.t1 [Chlamydomonas eustigma]|uniref:Uncharacterized protein n=1 Tax=Chlamydomonas eustigma TaxID=1157962 RepID=A0A250X789_9CHLO|nr:hypothetical protein CEUSTIGMA_g6355.t1 [Chlamydomonas eustigma]|eukprot:GAX78916.1 hypothetical protein CEUSTIGMA_g6355.t1 [Chlamydomonas eustigma]
MKITCLPACRTPALRTHVLFQRRCNLSSVLNSLPVELASNDLQFLRDECGAEGKNIPHPGSVLDFEYTSYAIKVSSENSKLKSGRLKNRPGPKLKRRPSKGYYAFEGISGNPAILKEFEIEMDLNVADNLDCSMSRDPTGHGASLDAADLNLRIPLTHAWAQHSKIVNSTPPYPDTYMHNNPNGNTTGQLERDWGIIRQRMGDQDVNSSTVSFTSMSSLFESISNTDHNRSQTSSNSSHECLDATIQTNLKDVEIQPETTKKMKSTLTHFQDLSSASLSAHNVYDLQMRVKGQNPDVMMTPRQERDEGVLQAAEGGESSQSFLGGSIDVQGGPAAIKKLQKLRQGRIAAGQHALGLRPHGKSSNPALTAQLADMEASEVRSRLKTIRRCLGGLTFRQVVTLVVAEPKLLTLTEMEMELQVMELLAFITFCPSPSFTKRQCERQEEINGSQQSTMLTCPNTVVLSGQVDAQGVDRNKESLSTTLSDASWMHRLTSVNAVNLFDPLTVQEAVRLIQMVPEVLTQPADYCAVASALMDLLHCLADRSVLLEGGAVPVSLQTDQQLLRRASSMINRRPALLSLRQRCQGRGRDQESGEDVDDVTDGISSHKTYFSAFLGVTNTLQDIFEMDDTQALNLIQKEPSLLTVLPGALHATAAAITQIGSVKLDLNVRREVVMLCPDLLCMSPGVLKATSRRLHTLLSKSKSWQQGLHRLLTHPKNLAVALSFDTSRYDRLDYLVHTKRDGAVGYKEALTTPEDDFRDMYPGYASWRRERGM